MRLVEKIVSQLPDEIETYYEPFIGGGAVFFALAPKIKHAVISDKNSDLITTYNIVKTRPLDLIARLQELADIYKNDTDYFYEVRSRHHLTDSLELAARMIFLNKTCFNGLYRVNARGEFNTSKGSFGPSGNNYGTRICIPSEIQNASAALQKATIVNGDFEEVVQPSKDDCIYCDPPYDGTKVSYQKEGFDQSDQIRLRDAADQWRSRGANVMLSNSYTDNIRALYRDYRVDKIKIQYKVFPEAMKNNGYSGEVLIMSYPAPSDLFSEIYY